MKIFLPILLIAILFASFQSITAPFLSSTTQSDIATSEDKEEECDNEEITFSNSALDRLLLLASQLRTTPPCNDFCLIKFHPSVPTSPPNA